MREEFASVERRDLQGHNSELQSSFSDLFTVQFLSLMIVGAFLEAHL